MFFVVQCSLRRALAFNHRVNKFLIARISRLFTQRYMPYRRQKRFFCICTMINSYGRNRNNQFAINWSSLLKRCSLLHEEFIRFSPCYTPAHLVFFGCDAIRSSRDMTRCDMIWWYYYTSEDFFRLNLPTYPGTRQFFWVSSIGQDERKTRHQVLRLLAWQRTEVTRLFQVRGFSTYHLKKTHTISTLRIFSEHLCVRVACRVFRCCWFYGKHHTTFMINVASLIYNRAKKAREEMAACRYRRAQEKAHAMIIRIWRRKQGRTQLKVFYCGKDQ